MATTNDIYAEMQRYAPLELAESWDNPGLLVDCGREVSPEMYPSSWCKRASLPSVCTPIWMPPRAA